VRVHVCVCVCVRVCVCVSMCTGMLMDVCIHCVCVNLQACA